MDERQNHSDHPALRGGLIALVAACLFGASTPLLQIVSSGIDSFWTAALLYFGAALTGLVLRRPSTEEAALRRPDLPRVIAMALFGAAVGPIALAWGLQRTSGASASLMLTFEAVVTTLLATVFYVEKLDGRVRVALALTTAGAAVLVIDRMGASGIEVLGLLSVLVATVAWGLDNTLSRGVANRDPGQVVMYKSIIGAVISCVIAIIARGPLPTLPVMMELAVIGAVGYGISLRFYLLAQRFFGAARTASVFAVAPFIGASIALAISGQAPSWLMTLGAILLAAGLILHLFERHSHEHRHSLLEHEHAHDHDDGHHDHDHPSKISGSHSHRHTHLPILHSHPHVPDEHHAHEH
jgi:drug/metabolite transporter (DMT)-like permease